MSEIFFKRNGIDDSGNSINILYKATYSDENGLKIYTNLADSSDDGILNTLQSKSPFHRDSDNGETDSDGEGNVINLKTIVEFYRAWDSSGEAFAWARR